MNFFEVVTLVSAIEKIAPFVATSNIEIDTTKSLGGFLAEDILAKENLPNFDRSTVDGYAVKASDTVGSSEGIPSIFEIVSTINIGEENHYLLNKNTACYVPTGGMLPKNADSVVMIEVTEKLGSTLLIKRPVAAYENVNIIGSDAKENTLLLAKGSRLNSQKISLLIANGIVTISIVKPLTVSIISSGDELVDPKKYLPIGKIRDTNTTILESLSLENHIVVNNKCRVNDSFVEIKEHILRESLVSDIVLISGGSSVGECDFTFSAIQELGKILFKGIAVKPGKPTIGGVINGKLVLGLPGHPYACYMLYRLLVLDGLKKQNGEKTLSILAQAGENFPSTAGKTTIVLVKLIREKDITIALPIYTKSAYLSSLALADGYCIIAEKTEGIYKNQTVEVNLL